MAASSALSAELSEQKVREMVLWVTAQEWKRAPIKKTDLMAAVDLKNRGQANQEHVLDKCKQVLKDIFGLELVESKEKKGIYFLLNAIKLSAEAGRTHLAWTEEENAKLGLLYSVLAVIFMSNDVVSDEDLFHFLRRMGVCVAQGRARGRRTHGGGPAVEEPIVPELVHCFGPCAKALVFKEWGTKQQYLDVKKVCYLLPYWL